jgi:7-carboxy-7-deazaguanine synthase
MLSTRTRDLPETEVLNKSLRINEIFFSLQGETSKSGLPTTFIRLTGCPLRCHYCDTEYAFHEGKTLELIRIIEQAGSYRTKHVTVTGGEPLAQKNCHLLLRLLCDRGYQVSLETSGAIDISQVDPRVKKIVDIKTPGSGEHSRNLLQNLEHISNHDEIKFVICNKEDYEWAKTMLLENKLNERCEVLFSPSHEELSRTLLADWILEDHLPVRFHIQLHKILWGDVRGK